MSAYSGWMRNYKAMGDEKLRYALKELEGGYGDAFYRVQDKGGLIDEHIAEARAQARIRGMVVGDNAVIIPPAPEGTLGEAKECSDCGKRRRHYVDDYICKDCRDALNAPVAAPTPEPTPSVAEVIGAGSRERCGWCVD
jgi:hypothetical protein